MNSKLIGLWAFFIGMVLAVATVFWDLGEWVVQVLIILGALAGFFHTFKDNLVLLGVVYLALSAAASSMSELAAVGPVITDLVTAFVSYLGPVVLTAMMIWGGAKLMADKTEE
ncbi:MAG: hypothetical protein ABFS17_10200 [Chloroflexota bacterium]